MVRTVKTVKTVRTVSLETQRGRAQGRGREGSGAESGLEGVGAGWGLIPGRRGLDGVSGFES